jgi:anti-anti-sigma regulatory factor
VAVEFQADVGKNRLFIRIEGRIDDAEVRSFADAIIKEMDRLRPGFDVVSDLTQAEPLGPEGSAQLKRVVEAQRERKYGRAVRIVGRSAQVALQFSRDTKDLNHEPYLAFSLEEAERLLDGGLP